MEEFIVAVFPEDNRPVFVDDKQCGVTNFPIPVSRGNHKISLGPPPDFVPPFQSVVVQSAPEVAPLRILFSKKGM
jgi:hypothetical protein